MFFIISLYLQGVIHISCVYGLILQRNQLNLEYEDTFANIFPLFSSSPGLCVVSNNEEVSSVFVKKCQKENKSVILQDYVEISPEECANVVFLDVTNLLANALFFSDKNTFNRSLYFVDVFQNTNVTRVQKHVSKVSSSEVVLISVKDGLVFQLSDVFSRSRSFLRSNISDILKRRRRRTKTNLGGKALTVACMHYPPFSILLDRSKPDDLDGIDVLLMRELSRQFNFSVDYLVRSYWGFVEDNGIWNKEGIGRAFQEGKVDLAFANFWQLPSFLNVLDFGPPLSKIQLVFMVRRPETVSFQSGVFVSIFKPRVWAAILAACCLVAVAHWLGIYWDHQDVKESWGGSAMTVFGHLTMTSSYKRVPWGCSRHILTSWSIVSLILTTSLSTGIVTRLTVPLFSGRVDSVKQMVEGQFYWTVEYYARFNNTGDMREALFNPQNQWHRKYEKLYRHMGSEEVLAKIGTEKKITVVVENYGDDFIVLDNYELIGHEALKLFRVAEEAIGSAYVSFGVRKHSALLEPLTVMAVKFMETGLTIYWKDEVLRRWPAYNTRHLMVEEDDPTFSEPKPLRLQRLQSVFKVLVGGLGVAFVVFLVEVLW